MPPINFIPDDPAFAFPVVSKISPELPVLDDPVEICTAPEKPVAPFVYYEDISIVQSDI
jgi:hypothetical protein